MTLRVSPQNLEAEKAVLGGCIVDSGVIPKVAAILSPADFYLPSHRKIFEAILALWNRREPVDLITVAAFLGKEVSVADIAAMAENALPTHAEAHARAVKETAQRRKLLEAIRQAEEDLYSPTEDSFSIAGRLGSTLSHLQNGGPKGFVSVSEVVVKTVRQIEKASERKDLVTGIPTGLRELDQKFGGIHPGELWIMAGRPSMGKTALATAIAHGSAEQGYGVAFVTAETPMSKIVQRLLASTSGIENRDLRRGKLDDNEIRSLVIHAESLTRLPLWILDSDRSWDRIKAKINALKLREPKLALAIIDYVGLLSAPVPRGERYLEVGRISSEGKSLAVELEIGVLLLAQLNREVEGRPEKRPKLSDLRESGSLEQDADLVGLIYREAYYNENARPKELTELDIAKNRDGRTGVIKLRFNEDTVCFSDWTDSFPEG